MYCPAQEWGQCKRHVNYIIVDLPFFVTGIAYWKKSLTNVYWIRNHIMVRITEIGYLTQRLKFPKHNQTVTKCLVQSKVCELDLKFQSLLRLLSLIQ